ncbi:hypothetical protein EV356DRAFT_68874 [Viridothelium virens]|uniref:Uncharacterized protein n=1 Tax=Viridothelium virens TaxID=1048519 RepID=A0A6A6HE12_VIRVR|nr:hypothetical protein EV356DRAFT_68874 [Viridothelium virens]
MVWWVGGEVESLARRDGHYLGSTTTWNQGTVAPMHACSPLQPFLPSATTNTESCQGCHRSTLPVFLRRLVTKQTQEAGATFPLCAVAGGQGLSICPLPSICPLCCHTLDLTFPADLFQLHVGVVVFEGSGNARGCTLQCRIDLHRGPGHCRPMPLYARPGMQEMAKSFRNPSLALSALRYYLDAKVLRRGSTTVGFSLVAYLSTRIYQ